MKYIPLFCYSFRWNIEVSYYEQKTFWSFCSYMVRSRKGIETLVNLINIAYCAMKILPYQDEAFSKYRTESAGIPFCSQRADLGRSIFDCFPTKYRKQYKIKCCCKALKQLIQKGSLIYKSCKLVQEL